MCMEEEGLGVWKEANLSACVSSDLRELKREVRIIFVIYSYCFRTIFVIYSAAGQQGVELVYRGYWFTSFWLKPDGNHLFDDDDLNLQCLMYSWWYMLCILIPMIRFIFKQCAHILLFVGEYHYNVIIMLIEMKEICFPSYDTKCCQNDFVVISLLQKLTSFMISMKYLN